MQLVLFAVLAVPLGGLESLPLIKTEKRHGATATVAWNGTPSELTVRAAVQRTVAGVGRRVN
jgi:hypothetical protein